MSKHKDIKPSLAARISEHIQKPDFKPEIVLNYDPGQLKSERSSAQRADSSTKPNADISTPRPVESSPPLHAETQTPPHYDRSARRTNDVPQAADNTEAQSPPSQTIGSAPESREFVTPNILHPEQPIGGPIHQSTSPTLAAPNAQRAENIPLLKTSPYRQGQKRVQSVVAPHVKTQIKHFLIQHDMKEEELLRHALNLFFRSQHLPEIAHDGFPPKLVLSGLQ